jgi:hypothetical protein
MITTSRLQVTGVTGGPLRIAGASLGNGAYELATAGGADYELQTERQTTMDNILFIPGIANPVSEINQLLFGAGQPGGSWIPTLSSAMIAANSFGSGVTDILDLSGNNNPFSQATSGSRGAWFREPKTGRRNLILNSAFVGTTVGSDVQAPTSWSRGAIPTAVAGYDATTESISFASSSSREYIQQGITLGVGETRLFSVVVTLGVATRFVDVIWTSNDPAANTARTARINGVAVNASDMIPAGTNLCELLLVSTTGTWTTNFRIGAGVSGNATVTATFREPQIDAATTRTAYQRVTTAFDVTEQGQRDCYGVRADGIDDFYQRAIDFSGTDKVTVFAAVRKLSDAATAVFLELSPSASTNNGGFALLAPSASGSERYTFNSRGTASAFAITSNSAFNAPVTNIVTCIGDIANDLCILRVDGTQVAAGASDQGTGNYRNDTLNLFRRNGATLPFNGNLYGLIVAGGSYPLSTIQRVERILSRITPTVNL